jgi:hypothetical protein
MKPGDNLERRRTNREELSKTMLLAYERARKLLSDPVLTIQETAFGDVYSKEQIDADIALTKRLKAGWEAKQTTQERNSKKVAEVLEAIILTEGELSEWFGKANTMKTSEYDDFKNKVDLVVEWFSSEDGSRLLALGVDVTFGTTKLEDKFLEMKSEIDRETLGSIQYFRDERGDFMGRRNNVPRVVIGVSPDVIETLAEYWNAKDKSAMRNHPIQHVILKEIQVQLQAMRDYALQTNKPHIAAAYQPAIRTISNLITEKGPGAYRPLLNDRIFNHILDLTKSTFKK